VRAAASILLNVIHLLGLTELRKVRLEEITTAISFGNRQDRFQGRQESLVGNPHDFRRAAVSWLKFLDALAVVSKPTPPLHDLLQQFVQSMRTERSFAESTLKAYGLQIHHFLLWYSKNAPDLSLLTLRDVEEFIDTKRNAGDLPPENSTS